MAWVRWSSPGDPHDYDSLVYIMDHVDGDMECVNCQLVVDATFRAATPLLMAAHVQDHINAGDPVPDFVIPSLLGEAPRWFDKTLAEMVVACQEGGGHIATWDADVPEWCRLDPRKLIEQIKKEGLSGGFPTE